MFKINKTKYNKPVSQKLGGTELSILVILYKNSYRKNWSQQEIKKLLKRKSPLYKELNTLTKKRFLNKTKIKGVNKYSLSILGKNRLERKKEVKKLYNSYFNEDYSSWYGNIETDKGIKKFNYYFGQESDNFELGNLDFNSNVFLLEKGEKINSKGHIIGQEGKGCTVIRKNNGDLVFYNNKEVYEIKNKRAEQFFNDAKKEFIDDVGKDIIKKHREYLIKENKLKKFSRNEENKEKFIKEFEEYSKEHDKKALKAKLTKEEKEVLNKFKQGYAFLSVRNKKQEDLYNSMFNKGYLYPSYKDEYSPTAIGLKKAGIKKWEYDNLTNEKLQKLNK